MNTKDKILYGLLFSVMYSISLLPMWVLYRISDFLYVIVYHVTGYRRKMVKKNLMTSFPEKSEAERLDIEKNFYAWFCDYIVETIKLMSISEKEMQRRMRFKNVEEAQQALASGKDVTLFLGHYCNWEWITAIGIDTRGEGILIGQIYHELESKVMDKIFIYIRGRFGNISIRMDKTLRTLIKARKEGKNSLIGYIADQVPGFHDMHCWPFFLNHDTPVYTGPEKMSRMLGACMFYMDIYRPRRGYYVCKMVKITDDASKEDNFFPTLETFRLLEQSIKERPAYWLWSHNRWKRTREQFNTAFTEEQRQQILSRP